MSDPTKGHKRQRSLNDTIVDMSKMRRLTTSLDSIREELRGVMDTEMQMEEVMKHVDVLDRILRESKRVVCSNALFPCPSTHHYPESVILRRLQN